MENTTNPNRLGALLKKYRASFFTLALVLGLGLVRPSTGSQALRVTASNLTSMIAILPPILVLIGLLDVWIDRETMIKYMGDKAGWRGFFFAFILGSFAAGPLYVAFPIAAILLKKQARYAYIIFFLGVWSSTKLPIAMYEISSFGLGFTLLHMAVNLLVFAGGSLALEKLISPASMKKIYQQASSMVDN